jgi:hypothetical protein
LCETLLQLVQRVGAHRASLTSKHHKSHGTIERGNFRRRERASDLLRETKPGHAATRTIALLHVVVDLDIAVTNRDLVGQALKSLPGVERNEPVPVHSEPG